MVLLWAENGRKKKIILFEICSLDEAKCRQTLGAPFSDTLTCNSSVRDFRKIAPFILQGSVKKVHLERLFWVPTVQ